MENSENLVKVKRIKKFIFVDLGLYVGAYFL